MRHETVTTPIKISIPGATKEELQRGVAAALKVFRDAGVHPYTAADGRFMREAWDIGGFNDDDVTNKQLAAAGVWDKADTAALEAACLDWDEARKPQSADLEIVHDPESQLADRPTAIPRLRKIARAKKWTKKDEDRISTYAWIIAADMDEGTARPFVDPINIGANRVGMDRYQGKDATASLQAFAAAVEALIEASEPRH